MGRIKTVFIKRITNKLVSGNANKFGKDFGRNKLAVHELTDCRSKKLRNVIAGYAVRLKKASEAGPKRRKAPVAAMAGQRPFRRRNPDNY